MKNNRTWVALGACVLLCLSFLLIFFGRNAKADANWGFSLSNLDKSCKPCDDFYQFAMGGWMKSNPIPPEYPTWGTFTELREKNITNMRTILEAAEKSTAAAGTNERKIGDYYASCMD